MSKCKHYLPNVILLQKKVVRFSIENNIFLQQNSVRYVVFVGKRIEVKIDVKIIYRK